MNNKHFMYTISCSGDNLSKKLNFIQITELNLNITYIVVIKVKYYGIESKLRILLQK